MGHPSSPASTRPLSDISAKSTRTLRESRGGSRVSFSDTGNKTIVVDSHLSNQKNEIWYSSEELKDFRSSSSPPATEESKVTRTNKHRSTDLVRALLSVQSEHKALGIKDPKGLRQMSRACSKESIKEAIYRAQDIVESDDTAIKTKSR